MFGRSAGILMPIFSLPSEQGIGCFGRQTIEWIDFVKACGFGCWQICPLGPTGFGDSPYQSLSAFASNPYFVDLSDLTARGWLRTSECEYLRNMRVDRVDYGALFRSFESPLRTAYARFRDDGSQRSSLEDFRSHRSSWVEPYALFRALKRRFDESPWPSWPEPFDTFESSRTAADAELRRDAGFHVFVQFILDEQWKIVKNYARKKNVFILGDIPLYIGVDSADVWAHRELFQWNFRRKRPRVVSGVPPDYFSGEGQLWGTPIFRWDKMKTTGYQWWMDRIRRNLEWSDGIRLDHFRGFYDYWAVADGSETARVGHWRRGPQDDFFRILRQAFPECPIVAEDLGDLHAGVTRMQKHWKFPGMAVLQFAFNSPDNPYLPHHLSADTVLYTGTHDNDTTVSWYRHASSEERDFCRRYLRVDGSTIGWDFVRAAYASVSRMAFVSLQDLLGLDGRGRINCPGTTLENWRWRCSVEDWKIVEHRDATYLNELAHLFDRHETFVASKPKYPSEEIHLHA
jgi:4-alpha-glucanotransferase